MITRRTTLILGTAPLVALAVAACGDRGPENGWAGAIDTLASGTIMVSNPGPGVWREGEGWSIRETLRIGSAMDEGPALFGGVSGIAVDAEGRIHVLDRQAKELRTFDSDGAHLRTVGREGSGPGEFRDPLGLAVSPDGSRLIAVDAGNNRYAVFSGDGEYFDSHVRGLGGYALPWIGGFDTEGRFHERVPGGVIRLDSAWQAADTLEFPRYDSPIFELKRENMRMTAAVPFASSQTVTWDPRGYLWTAVTGDYTITQISAAGDTLRVIRRSGVDRVPVRPDEREEAVERLEWFTRQGGRIDASAIPSEKPFFNVFHIEPDGHIWVRRTPADADEHGARYDVFDPDGRFLGEVQAPNPLYMPVFHDDIIHAVNRDSLGVQYLVRHNIDRGSGTGEH